MVGFSQLFQEVEESKPEEAEPNANDSQSNQLEAADDSREGALGLLAGYGSDDDDSGGND
eukprot:scaffold57586_cov48-Prasinocladus_malaysianus.AAC.1